MVDYNEEVSHTKVIQAHYVYLVETLDLKSSGLLDHLVAYQVVSVGEKDDIYAEKTSFGKNEKLLSILSRKSARRYQLFLDALDVSGQHHVRRVITDQRGMLMFDIHHHHHHHIRLF